VDNVEVPVEMFKSEVDIIDFAAIKRDGAEWPMLPCNLDLPEIGRHNSEVN
jgi:hypothetical protein